ncbi:MAG: hypothetical protein QM740_21290 [Acidovorax sp.]
MDAWLQATVYSFCPDRSREYKDHSRFSADYALERIAFSRGRDEHGVIDALFQQFPDIRALLEGHAVCIVKSWERRAGAQSGVGMQLLKAALQLLKKRFPEMRLLVLIAHPRQFPTYQEEGPTAVLEARFDAMERLEEYIRICDPAHCVSAFLRIVRGWTAQVG